MVVIHKMPATGPHLWIMPEYQGAMDGIGDTWYRLAGVVWCSTYFWHKPGSTGRRQVHAALFTTFLPPAPKSG